MPDTTTCPQCQRKLALPWSALGQFVRCPSCQATFTATRDIPLVPRAFVRELVSQETSRPRGPASTNSDHPGGSTGVRSPHRGGKVLALGLSGLLLFWVPLAGWVLGGLALTMGGSDLLEMGLGNMDPSGKGITQVGKNCGLVAVVLSTGVLFLACLLNAAPGWRPGPAW